MEIGSIFEIDPKQFFQETNHNLENELLNLTGYHVEYFNSGRAAIQAYLESHIVEYADCTVYMPAYSCSSVYEAAERAKVHIKTFPICRDFSIEENFLAELEMKKGDVLYLLQFFGKQISDKCISVINEKKSKGITVIEDVSLALMAEKSNNYWFGDVVIGSLRKWFEIPDGGFIAYRGEKKIFAKQQASNDYTLYYFAAQVMKNEYIKDNQLNKQLFLDLSGQGMKILFSDYTIREMSKVSKMLLNTMDYISIQKKRKENVNYIYDLLKGVKEINLPVGIESGIVPLGLVILVEKRNELFNHLISNGVYCNIHWRDCEYFKTDEDARWLSNHCITLPCDHRYSFEHMEYIYDVIKRYFEGE